MESMVAERVLRLVGLGMRARTVVVGVDRVRDAVKRDKVVFAIVAPDASRHSLEKVLPLLTARRVRFVQGPSAAELGRAVGKDQTAVVGIIDPRLARGIRALVEPSSSGASRRRPPQEDV